MIRASFLGLCLSWLLVPAVHAAPESVEVHAFVNDVCIIADEPFFVPKAADQTDASRPTPKFLPLIGVVVGELATWVVNHETQVAANRIRAHGARKDTRYALSKQMNLYRADLSPAPVVRINANLGCMTIVAGSLEADPTDCRASYLPKTLAPETMKLPHEQWKTSRTDDSIENQLRRANVCVKGKARAVYEARFEFSDDATAYRLQDAGYRIDSLLTSEEKGATRDALYTLKISSPSATDQQEVLSAAWVNVGTVRAGARSSGTESTSRPWLRVPALTPESRRTYNEKTKVHQEVMTGIETLKRDMTRNQRMLSELDARIAASSGDVADGLKQERTRLTVQYQTQSVELEARKAEYQDLPHEPLEFMPVTIEVAVTETESEKKTQLALADLIGSQASVLSSAASDAATGALH